MLQSKIRKLAGFSFASTKSVQRGKLDARFTFTPIGAAAEQLAVQIIARHASRAAAIQSLLLQTKSDQSEPKLQHRTSRSMRLGSVQESRGD